MFVFYFAFFNLVTLLQVCVSLLSDPAQGFVSLSLLCSKPKLTLELGENFDGV